MNSYDYRTLWQEAKEMRSWQIAAICAVCGEKISPIVRFLGLPETSSLARECVDFAWSAVTNASPDIEEGERLIEALHSTPEWKCELPDSLPLVVARSLSFSKFAVDGVITASNSSKADNVGFSTILDTAELFDLAIDQQSARDKGGETLVEAEKVSQLSVMKILRRHTQPSVEIVRALRQEASAISSLFETNLPVYCSHYLSCLIRTARTSQ